MKNQNILFFILFIFANFNLYPNDNDLQSSSEQAAIVPLKMDELDLILKNPDEERVYLSNDIKQAFTKFNKILSNIDIPQSQISQYFKQFCEVIKNEDSFTSLEIAYNTMLNSQILLAKNKSSFDDAMFTEISNAFVLYLNDLKNKSAQVIHINDEVNNDDNTLRKRKKVYCKLLVKDVLKVGKCLVVCGNEIVEGTISVNGPAVFNNSTLFNRPVTINVPVSRVAGVDALTVIGTTDLNGPLIVRGIAYFGSDVNVTGNLNVAGQINSASSNSNPPVTNGANVGSGQGQIFRDKTGTTLNFKTLVAGTNLTITNNPDDVTINATATGDVTGPVTSTDNALVRFDGATGKVIQNSGAILDDSNNLTGVNDLTTVGDITTLDVNASGNVTGNQLISSTGNIDTGASSLVLGASAMSMTLGAGTSDITLGNSSTVTVAQGALQTISNPSTPVVIDNASGQLGVAPSSMRFKNNVKDMGDTSSLFKLRPVTFTYKNNKIAKNNYGLIAEEVEKFLPDLVSYDKDGKPFTVQYNVLSCLLLNELIKLRKEVDELNAKLKISQPSLTATPGTVG